MSSTNGTSTSFRGIATVVRLSGRTESDRPIESWPTEGVTGLYTRTLFRYDQRLMARLSPALELGRSFVRAEYQKNYTALLLLWKGIGQFVVRHPQYRVLFGTVSISARYSDSSQRLLMAFLLQNHLDRNLAELAEAINPYEVNPAPPVSTAIPQSIEEANRLVTRAEAGEKGVPVLLRQYPEAERPVDRVQRRPELRGCAGRVDDGRPRRGRSRYPEPLLRTSGGRAVPGPAPWRTIGTRGLTVSVWCSARLQSLRKIRRSNAKHA